MAKYRLYAVVAVVGLLFAAHAHADAWERIWQAFEQWDGARRVELTTGLNEPYASPVYRRLVNQLRARGFTVFPADSSDAGDTGLLAELRTTDDGAVIAVSRAVDGALLIVEGLEPTLGPPSEAGGGQAVEETQAEQSAPPQRTARFTLTGHPKRVAALPKQSAGPGNLDLLLLDAQGLEWMSVEDSGLRTRARYETDTASNTALHIDVGNIDADAPLEAVAVWGEDRRVPSRGWSTRVVSRVLEINGDGLQAEGAPSNRYLRIVDDRLLAQSAGEFTVFKGPVQRLVPRGEGFSADERAALWDDYGLYELTPTGEGRAATWNDPQTLAVATTKGPISTARRLADLGSIDFPSVQVRFKNPGFGGLGLSLSGKQEVDRKAALPRRVLVGADGALYTIQRRRAAALPGLSRPQGRDSVVRWRPEDSGAGATPIHEPVNAYILDFALIEAKDDTRGVVLLLNERPDGSGAASLHIVRHDDS